MKKNWNKGKLKMQKLENLTINCISCFKRISGVLFILSIILLFSCNSKNGQHDRQHDEDAVYTCPMHPEIIQNESGICPICKMDLVKKEEQVNLDDSIGLNTVARSANASVIASIKVIQPELKEVTINYEAPGYIDYDTRTYNNIASRYSGRIEKLYVKYAFQPVKKGEKLFEIYSPELLTAQQNLIYLLDNDAAATELIAAAKQKLILLGLTASQVNQLEKTREAMYSLPVYSPYTGHIHEMVSSNVMNNSMNRNLTSPPLSLKEGMYVDKGQTVFNVVNPHKVWAILKVYSDDISKVALDQPVSLTIEGQSEVNVNGKIDFILPFYTNDSKTMNVRVYIDNTHHGLKVGTLVEAAINAGKNEGLWLPKSAVLDLGKDKIVWLETNEATFEAHKVQTGNSTNELTEIVEGLSVDDQVASNAQFLVDSKSFVKITDNEKD